MQWLRSILFDVIFTLWTVLLSPSVFVLYAINASNTSIRRLSLFWANGAILLLKYIVGLSYKEIGKSNIVDEPMLIICNHQSTFETLLLPVLFPNALFVCKVELARIPVVGWCLKKYPMIMIDRSKGAKALAQLRTQSQAAIRENFSVVIFPEGTRQSVDDDIVFRRGVEHLYKILKVPVLPIVVNSGVFWGPDRLMKYDGIVLISYLPTILPGLDPEEFRQTLESCMNLEKRRLVDALDLGEWIDALG